MELSHVIPDILPQAISPIRRLLRPPPLALRHTRRDETSGGPNVVTWMLCGASKVTDRSEQDSRVPYGPATRSMRPVVDSSRQPGSTLVPESDE